MMNATNLDQIWPLSWSLIQFHDIEFKIDASVQLVDVNISVNVGSKLRFQLGDIKDYV